MTSFPPLAAPLTWPIYPDTAYIKEKKMIRAAFALFDRDNRKVVLKELVESVDLSIRHPFFHAIKHPIRQSNNDQISEHYRPILQFLYERMHHGQSSIHHKSPYRSLDHKLNSRSFNETGK